MSERINKTLSIIAIVSASFTFICYVFYIFGGTVASDSGGVFVSVFMLGFSSLPLIFAKFIKKVTGRFFNALKIIYTLCLSFYMIFFLVFSSIIVFNSEKEPVYNSKQTLIIVCGSKVDGYTPGELLKPRLDKAYEILLENPDALCIVSGGQGDDESISEALCMKTYLVAMGIPSTRIYMEDQSRNTEENIEYSIKIMKEKGISTESNIICVSSDFHTPRVALIANEYGLDVQCASATSPSVIKYLSSLVREFMSYIKYFIFK